jgi:hypothetical protein
MSVDTFKRSKSWDFICEKFALAAEIDVLIVRATFKSPDIVKSLRRCRGRILRTQCCEELENVQQNFTPLLKKAKNL